MKRAATNAQQHLFSKTQVAHSSTRHVFQFLLKPQMHILYYCCSIKITFQADYYLSTQTTNGFSIFVPFQTNFETNNITAIHETNILTHSRRSYLAGDIIFLPILYIILALKNSFSKPTLYIIKHG